MKQVEYKQEAIKESMDFFNRDDYERNQSLEDLAKILEIVRAEVENKITKYNAYEQIKRIFPE